MWWSSRREGNIAGNSKFPPQPAQNQPTHKKATKGAKNKNESQKRIKCRYCLVKVCVNYLEILRLIWERELCAEITFSDFLGIEMPMPMQCKNQCQFNAMPMGNRIICRCRLFRCALQLQWTGKALVARIGNRFKCIG